MLSNIFVNFDVKMIYQPQIVERTPKTRMKSANNFIEPKRESSTVKVLYLPVTMNLMSIMKKRKTNIIVITILVVEPSTLPISRQIHVIAVDVQIKVRTAKDGPSELSQETFPYGTNLAPRHMMPRQVTMVEIYIIRILVGSPFLTAKFPAKRTRPAV